MNKKLMLAALAFGFLAAGCDSETRNGSLTLNGTAPIVVNDSETGKAVEFGNGAVKVTFQASSRTKFSVTLAQNGRKAKFSGKVPANDSWDFTLRGSDIGQSFDLTSARKVQLYGEPETRLGTGSPCGMNGTYVTEETWQKGNEDWKVAFTASASGETQGVFESHRQGDSYLVDSRDLYCRERPQHEPRGGRDAKAESASFNKLSSADASSVKFD